MVLISALALVVVFSMLAYVPGLTASTGKIAVVKSGALEIISRYDGFYFIADIEGPITHTHPDEITIVIGGDPLDPVMEGELEDLDLKLEEKKLYTNASDVTILVEHLG